MNSATMPTKLGKQQKEVPVDHEEQVMSSTIWAAQTTFAIETMYLCLHISTIV